MIKTQCIKTYRLALTSSTLIVLSLSCIAQEPENHYGLKLDDIQRKSQVPERTQVTMPKSTAPMTFTLPNGMRAVVIEDHRSPTITLLFAVDGAGPATLSGKDQSIAKLGSSLLMPSSETAAGRAYVKSAEGFGVEINTYANDSSQYAAISARGLSDNINDWFPLVCQLVLQPTFSNVGLSRLKQDYKIQMRNAPVATLALRLTQEALFGSHTFATSSFSEKQIESVSQQVLARWYQDHFSPQATVVGIRGDISVRQVKRLLVKQCGSWQNSGVVVKKSILSVETGPNRFIAVNRPDSVQSVIYAGSVSVSQSDKDFAAVSVLSYLLGGSPVSRLYQALRQNKGYTYDIGTSLLTGLDAGMFCAHMSVRSDVADAAVAELLKQLDRIRTERVPATELGEARLALTASRAISREDPSLLVAEAVEVRMAKNSDSNPEHLSRAILSVSSEDVQRVARLYLDPGHLQVVVVGDLRRAPELMARRPLEVRSMEAPFGNR